MIKLILQTFDQLKIKSTQNLLEALMKNDRTMEIGRFIEANI